MELNRKIINLSTIISVIILIVLDVLNFIRNLVQIENFHNIISNTITFVSILLGFISAIYVMILSDSYLHVKKLLRDNDLWTTFNKSFRELVYCGFISTILLIISEICIGNLLIFRWLLYITVPLLMRFLLLSNNTITTISKMIIAEEKLKQREENKF